MNAVKKRECVFLMGMWVYVYLWNKVMGSGDEGK